MYNIQKILGKGGLSIVYFALEQETGRKVAIKEFLYPRFFDPYTHENDCETYWENEVLNTQAQFRSGKKCVEVLNYGKYPDLQTPEYYIVLSFIEGKTFLDFYREFITTCRGLENLDLTTMVRNIFIPLAELLDYCHSTENIVHRDFAVSNIIIQSDKEDMWPVLIDWGVSKYLGPEWIYHTPKPYMAADMPKDIPVKQKGAPPEVRFGYMPCAASDIYYFGHLLYFVFTGGIMREDSENTSPEEFILEPKKFNMFVPDDFNALVKELTQYEPANRPRNMKVIIKLLKDLITIREIHWDFEILAQPDTEPCFSGVYEDRELMKK